MLETSYDLENTHVSVMKTRAGYIRLHVQSKPNADRLGEFQASMYLPQTVVDTAVDIALKGGWIKDSVQVDEWSIMAHEGSTFLHGKNSETFKIELTTGFARLGIGTHGGIFKLRLDPKTCTEILEDMKS